MRLVSYLDGGTDRLGIERDGRVISAEHLVSNGPRTMAALLDEGPGMLARLRLASEAPWPDTGSSVDDLPRAHILVLAGSIMGGDITRAVQELQETGIPVISLNQVGSVSDVVDLVVSDPVQAGTMAVMAIADTARFDLSRQRGKRY